MHYARDYHIMDGESFYYPVLMHEDGKGAQRDKYMAQFYFGDCSSQECGLYFTHFRAPPSYFFF